MIERKELTEQQKEIFIAIRKEMKGSDDQHPEGVLDYIADSLGFEFEEVEDGDWDDQGKYQWATVIYKITTTDGSFLLSVTVQRTGSYYSGYYYSIWEVDMVVAEEVTRTITETVYTAVKVEE